MYGVVDFYKAAKKAGIKPIIGCEVYLAKRGRMDKVHEYDADPYHLILLCKNRTGYQNLIYMVSCAFTEGFYNKPRIDMELLREHADGLICMSACLAGQIPRLLVQDEYNQALQVAKEFDDTFGRGNFYLELQDHGIPEQQRVNAGLCRIAEETGIPLTATNDAHYLAKEDAYLQDVLMCIQMNKMVDDTDRMKFASNEFYIKSGDEMAALFPEHEEAIENTGKIADMCNVEFEFGNHHLPLFQLPEGETDSLAYLKKQCEAGFHQRYNNPEQQHWDRLAFELDMIAQMGFVDYFLIVSDFISYAKSRGNSGGPGARFGSRQHRIVQSGHYRSGPD